MHRHPALRNLSSDHHSGLVLASIFAGTLTRDVVPIFDGSDCRLWMAVSQISWMLGFGAFPAAYIPIRIRPRRMAGAG